MAQKNRAEAQAAALLLLRGETPLPPPPRLRALREASDLTLDALAALLGTSRPVVHAWEHGRSAPDAPFRHKLDAWSARVVADLGVNTAHGLPVAAWLTAEEADDVRRLGAPPSEAA